MTFWQGIQPPINPLAMMLNNWIEPAVSHLGIRTLMPHFSLTGKLITQVTVASLGLVLSVLLVIGVILAFRRNRSVLQSWRVWTMVAGFAGFLLALSQFVPGTIGRIHCVFLFFAIPLAMTGWNLMRPQILRVGLYLCLVSSVLSLVLNPERPLWPARQIHQTMTGMPHFKRLAKVIEPYLLVSERARSGETLVQAIPDNEPALIMLAGKDNPLLALFRPYSLGRDVLLFAPHTDQRGINHWQVNYVIVGGGAEEYYPELCRYLEQSGDYEQVARHDYTSTMACGAETWKLYRRKVLLPVSAYKPS